MIQTETKSKAIALRKEGLSYSEILCQIPVAKSTLSLWLREIGLAKKQVQRITKKKLEAARRGGQVRKKQRIFITEQIYKKASLDIKNISERELWLMGVALYWAEGSKEKEYYPGSGVKFTNSDPYMVKFFLRWLVESCAVDEEKISFDLYIHDMYRNRTENLKKYWSKVTGFSINKFDKIYFKRNKITIRRNVGDLYYGVLRVKVLASSNFLRQIAGWTKAIVEETDWGIV
ncbi:MAG: hypothetical protein HQ402_02335 [Parcubacteria group bacterium]|nr:hypothetical protein [Parcubacteria group bacterium]